MGAPQNEPVDHAKAHSAALFSAISDSTSALVPELCAECRRYIAAGVPATDVPGNLLRIFIRYRDWVRSPDVVALFGAYVAAGYIDLSAPVLVVGAARSYPDGCHALEAAVMEGNAGVMVQMVAHGADPSRAMSAAVLHDTPGAGSLFQLIAAIHSQPRVEIMTALLIDAVLRRQIASVSTTESQELDLPIGRVRRRRPGV